MVPIDLLQLPRSIQGYSYLVVVVDHYSKWLAVSPIKSKSSENVTKAFLYSILPFLPYSPTKILSDNGREFIAPEFENILTDYNIAHIYTTPYSPSSNGAVERVNRTIIQHLRLALTEKQSWVELLPKIVIVYNHSIHTALDCSPCEFLLNKSHKIDPRLIGESSYWIEPHKNFTPFKEWDLVGLKQRLPGNLTANKFAERFVGPYMINKIQTNKLSYIIRSEFTDKLSKVHYN